jgi:hypothetical protein
VHTISYYNFTIRTYTFPTDRLPSSVLKLDPNALVNSDRFDGDEFTFKDEMRVKAGSGIIKRYIPKITKSVGGSNIVVKKVDFKNATTFASLCC